MIETILFSVCAFMMYASRTKFYKLKEIHATRNKTEMSYKCQQISMLLATAVVHMVQFKPQFLGSKR